MSDSSPRKGAPLAWGAAREMNALEVLGTSTTRRERRALLDSLRDVALDAVALAAHRERAHAALLVERIADANLREG